MFTRRYKKCRCINNTACCNTANNMLEDKCNDVCPCNYEMNVDLMRSMK